MNTLITRTIASQIRFFSTPIFNSTDIYKYIDSNKLNYKNKNGGILESLNKKDVSYSSNYKTGSQNYKSFDSYKHMYTALPINNTYKSER
tara:strand:+ start:456 stop:725 length:270 start_codon:yes stop_codon:yes gene_type:complete